MENDSQNLKIRVVMKPATAAGEAAQYRYNWRRVALLAVPVILLLGLTVKFVLDKPETLPPEEVATTPASSTKTPLPQPPAAQQQASETEAADTSAIATAPEQPVLSVEQSPPATTESRAEEQAPAAAEPAVATIEATVASTVESTVESTTEPAPVATATALQPGHTRQLSSKVKRFQLTNAIEDKEPRGNIEDIRPGPDGVLRVYVFSEVTDMKDDVIHYRWIRNGKQQANVKIGVWSNRWRSNSSKYVAADMHGDWQVRMENNKGELLAEASFSY